jgi:hypothetical protein
MSPSITSARDGRSQGRLRERYSAGGMRDGRSPGGVRERHSAGGMRDGRNPAGVRDARSRAGVPTGSPRPGLLALLPLLSLRRPALAGAARIAAIVLQLVIAGLLAWIGGIHLHLWQEGYRFIPTNGPLFLVDAVAAFVLVAATLLWAAPLAGVVAAGFAASTLGALVISLTVGLFGFRESISASFVVLSIVIESVTMVTALGLAALLSHGRQRSY